jgi:hypothetical protein
MTKVEKSMNKGELRSFKQFDLRQHSMLPGLHSNSPTKDDQTNQVAKNHYRSRSILAPPLNYQVDNSLAKVNYNEVPSDAKMPMRLPF